MIAYHPPIFEAVKRLVAGSLVFDAIRRGVALYSPHTALDVAEGGTNDMLADAIGIGADRAPLRLAQTKATPVQARHVRAGEGRRAGEPGDVRRRRGRIGNYRMCSFRSPGTGTFFGDEGTNPTVGESGRLEEAQEVRVETVVPIAKVDVVIRALCASHPYEEPAFDLQQLAAPPEGLGLGRVGDFAQPVERGELIERIKRELSIGHVLVAGPADGAVRRAAVCAGACGDLLDDAIAAKAEFYVTGEMRHHDALKAARAGLTVVCTLHSNSERAVLKRLKGRLEDSLPGLPVVLSRQDRDPFSIR